MANVSFWLTPLWLSIHTRSFKPLYKRVVVVFSLGEIEIPDEMKGMIKYFQLEQLLHLLPVNFFSKKISIMGRRERGNFSTVFVVYQKLSGPFLDNKAKSLSPSWPKPFLAEIGRKCPIDKRRKKLYVCVLIIPSNNFIKKHGIMLFRSHE